MALIELLVALSVFGIAAVVVWKSAAQTGVLVHRAYFYSVASRVLAIQAEEMKAATKPPALDPAGFIQDRPLELKSLPGGKIRAAVDAFGNDEGLEKVTIEVTWEEAPDRQKWLRTAFLRRRRG